MGTQDQLTTFVQNVELVRVRGRESGALDDPGPQSLRERLRRRIGFILVVAAPTLITAFYMLFLAVPRYESSAKFVVRLPGNGQASQIANMLSGTSVIRSVEDGYIVAAYVVSRDAMRELVAKDHFRDMLGHTGLDILWRYPPLALGDTDERLYKYFTGLVTVSYDQTTGIITLRAQGFTPQNAQLLVSRLLTHAEELINTMNDRAQQDAVRVALHEVDVAKDQAYRAADAMTAFRNREKIIDPMLVSNSVVQNITALALSTAQANAELAQLQKTSPESPQIRSLRIKVASLTQQIRNEREQLAGANGSLAPSIAEYDKLLLNEQFAERMFSSALASLESARVEALRQRAFVEEITKPNLPDHPSYPYRILSILGTLLIMSMVYRIGRVFVADTIEHASR